MSCNTVPKITSPLVVVANRLPFILRRNEETGKFERKQSAGGLVTAVAPAVVACNGMWVGWPGCHLEDANEPIPESAPDDKAPTAGLRSDQVVAVGISKEIFDSYYNGCCNGTFWPLFHSMPDRAIFNAEHYQAYARVNEVFAEDTMKAMKTLVSRPGYVPSDEHVPIIWIHDYHLMLAANAIRSACEEENINCKLGFFLHIPFPPWDIFRLFPWDDEILQGMLGCDLVGFHIEDYCRNFLDCCARRLGCKVDRRNKLVEFCGRTVRVRTLPIGIPFDRFVQMANDAPRVVKAEGASQIVLGVDRLDYTKGIVQRMRAFERLFEKHPEHREKVTLLQVAVPSRTDVREYQALKEEIDQEVGRINGSFSTPNWSPIRYIYGCVSQSELAAFYRDSSVGLVTPLRDGMNLVAKEYVACQVDKPGVLILSPFAGAGETMHEALVVNPYEINDVADMIHRAITMPEDERQLRMYHLRRRERQMDVTHWLNAFLSDMGAVIAEDGAERAPAASNQIEPMTLDDFDEFLASYIDETSKLALLLDYDGTLAPIAPKPHLAILPRETKKVLLRLSNIADVHIAIISGRSLPDVREMVGIDGLTYAGNHGLEILHPDGTKFVHPVPQGHEEGLTAIKQELQDQCCHDGAWIEPKGALLTFHYRSAPQNMHSTLKAQATRIITSHGFTASPAHCAIEAKPAVQWDKGRACIHILRTMYGVDWSERVRVIYCGDDHTDEDAMRALKGIATTFRVTSSHAVRTAATRRLSSTDSVLTLLKWVENHMQGRPMKSVRRRSSFSARRQSLSRNSESEQSFEMQEPADYEQYLRDIRAAAAINGNVVSQQELEQERQFGKNGDLGKPSTFAGSLLSSVAENPKLPQRTPSPARHHSIEASPFFPSQPVEIHMEDAIDGTDRDTGRRRRSCSLRNQLASSNSSANGSVVVPAGDSKGSAV